MEIYRDLYNKLVKTLANRVQRDMRNGYDMEYVVADTVSTAVGWYNNAAAMYGFLLGYQFANTANECYDILC